MTILKTTGAVLATAALLGSTAACGSDSEKSSDSSSAAAGSSSSAPSGSGETGTLTVFAAASLKKTFTELGKDFEKSHPGVKVTFDFDGSSNLVSQIQQGAPADVFASADQKNMTKVVDADLMSGTPSIFVRNKMTIVTPKDNPKHVTGLESLTKPGIQLVICAQQVPCGSATAKIEEQTHLKFKPVSEESKVTDVLAKVTSGDADAGLVYVTDAKGGDQAKIDTIDIPDKQNVINSYPIGVVKASKKAKLAEEFITLVESKDGEKVLTDAGFMPPK